MNRKKISLLFGAALALLSPNVLCSATAPLYGVITKDLVPTASVKIIDDSLKDLAIVEVSLSNPTDNLIALTGLYFADSATITAAEASATASYTSPVYTYYWSGNHVAKYQSNMYLAPHSNYLPRRTTIHKTKGDYYEIQASTYSALKNGGELKYAFSGIVYSAKTYTPQVDYTVGDVYPDTSYNADTNHTEVVFGAYSQTLNVDYDSWFASFSFAGISYQHSQYGSGNVEDNKAWVDGYHESSEFTNLSVALYQQKETLFSSEKDINPTHTGQRSFLDYLPYIVFGFLGLILLSLVAGLIVLGVWLDKKKKHSNAAKH
jgi:hypothetical protein